MPEFPPFGWTADAARPDESNEERKERKVLWRRLYEPFGVLAKAIILSVCFYLDFDLHAAYDARRCKGQASFYRSEEFPAWKQGTNAVTGLGKVASEVSYRALYD